VVSTDRAWQQFGSENPYWGVLTKRDFEKERFDDDARRAFFATGEDYVETVFTTVREHLDPHFAPRRTLDFGCGVGRLALPLARRAEHVVGVDISPGMLAEAAANATRAGVDNIEFVLSDDALSRVPGRFDLVHSFIVLQHIPPERGEVLLAALLDRLAEGGVGILHLTYAHGSRTPPLRRALTRLYERMPIAWSARSVLKREPLREPMMQMNRYDLSRVFRIVQEAGCHDVHVRFTEASHLSYEIYGVILHVRKRRLDTTTHS
jgi:SAM-dependent methyltransferase